jgi:hypothetical protein
LFRFNHFFFPGRNIFTFAWDWLVVDLICLAMNGANLGGYLKCARAGRSLTQAATNYAVNYAVNDAMNGNRGGGQSDNDFN